MKDNMWRIFEETGSIEAYLYGCESNNLAGSNEISDEALDNKDINSDVTDMETREEN